MGESVTSADLEGLKRKFEAQISAIKADLGALTIKREEGLKTPEDVDEAKLFKMGQEAEKQRLTYQQAAAWVTMANTVTWSISSIYLVAAFVALNSAISNNNLGWRSIAGYGVALLALFWLIIDIVYYRTARDARERLASLEESMKMPVRFFTEQNKNRTSRRLVTGALWGSMFAVGYIGLVPTFTEG